MEKYSEGEREDIRVRFAPSPTGLMHAGNMRIAIFNYLFAKKKGGKLILRMEDTDTKRSKMEFADLMIEELGWIGIKWDEGPFFQSQHSALYSKVIDQLYAQRLIYPCFCSKEQLEKDRKEATRKSLPPLYSGRCRELERDETKRRAESEPYSLRFAVSGERLEHHDMLRGKVETDLKLIGDFIVLRSDQTVTYNLAAAVDDAMMKISHVLRGEDHMSNTPKQIMIMQALGYSPPQYAHLPLIFSMEGKKLSKRDTGSSISELIENGYLPESVFNFLALIGWSPKDKSEEMKRNEMVTKFSIDRIALRGAQYDLGKLKWLNGIKIKKLTPEKLIVKGKPFIKIYSKKFENLTKEKQLSLVETIKENIETFKDIDRELKIFFEQNLTAELKKAVAGFPAAKVAEAAVLLCAIEQFEDFTAEVFAKTGAKGKNLYMPLRAALTGALHGPELKNIYNWFTPNERTERLKKFLEFIK